jgi:carbon-monoxide dehydrogenase small subunit
MPEPRKITLRVNGTERSAPAEPRRSLADFLREDLGLTGTHLGCEHGVCGACTVLMDGASVRACLVLAIQAEGADVLTVEGLADGDELHPVQAAFQREHGLQCGFCTPGFLMTSYELLQERRADELTDEEIREALGGNICRCTGYESIVAAVRSAAEAMR